MRGKYDDIIDLPHPTSPRHPRMRMIDRAAQFSPFSALTGYEDAIEESGRLTQGEIELDDHAREQLDRQLRFLHDHEEHRPTVLVTYFLPDLRKEGGAYIEIQDSVLRVDPQKQLLVFEDRSIPMGSILQLRILRDKKLGEMEK
ncbi:MAG: hypothetical protein J6K89_09415 [Oscillospiraceae bacterium]|nr:hypothetical protein [Oscillospiraceae bacterium]